MRPSRPRRSRPSRAGRAPKRAHPRERVRRSRPLSAISFLDRDRPGPPPRAGRSVGLHPIPLNALKNEQAYHGCPRHFYDICSACREHYKILFREGRKKRCAGLFSAGSAISEKPSTGLTSAGTVRPALDGVARALPGGDHAALGRRVIELCDVIAETIARPSAPCAGRAAPPARCARSIPAPAPLAADGSCICSDGRPSRASGIVALARASAQLRTRRWQTIAGRRCAGDKARCPISESRPITPQALPRGTC